MSARLLAILLAATLLACGEDAPTQRPDMSAPLDMSVDMSSDLSSDLSEDLPGEDLPGEDMPEDVGADLPEDMPAPDMADDMAADLAPDMTPDMTEDMAEDMAEDMGEDMPPDPCAGVDCGPNGRCVAAQAAPSCDCDMGFVPSGLTCVPIAQPPVITSSAPVAVDERQAIVYLITCQDPDGQPVTLSVAADDTCGGVITNNNLYRAPTDEDDGGASCLLSIVCDSLDGQATQQASVAIAEVNLPPVFSSSPGGGASWGRPGQLAITAADPDRPAQQLSISFVSTTCSFPVAVAPDGQMSWTCGPVESCSADVAVSDGVVTTTKPFSITCSNSSPIFTGSTNGSASEQDVHQSTLFCSDPNSDPLTLTVGVNTCGAAVTPVMGAPGAVAITFTPDEDDGGTTCQVEVFCSDSIAQVARTRTITIAEVNTPPVLNDPGPITSLTGQPHTFQLTAADPDRPVQQLSISLASTTCPFAITASPAGQVSYTCPQAAASCSANFSVSDGARSGARAVTLTCANP